MNHDILKSVILDQHEVIKHFDIIDRKFKFEDKLNYVLVGLRRAGKSTVLYQTVLDLGSMCRGNRAVRTLLNKSSLKNYSVKTERRDPAPPFWKRILK